MINNNLFFITCYMFYNNENINYKKKETEVQLKVNNKICFVCLRFYLL